MGNFRSDRLKTLIQNMVAGILLGSIGGILLDSCTKRTSQQVTAEQLQIVEEARRRADSSYQITQQRLDEVMAAVVSAEAAEGIMQQPGAERTDSPAQYRQRMDVLIRLMHERRQKAAAGGVALEDVRKSLEEGNRLKSTLESITHERDSLKQIADLTERKLRYANERLIETRKTVDSLKSVLAKKDTPIKKDASKKQTK